MTYQQKKKETKVNEMILLKCREKSNQLCITHLAKIFFKYERKIKIHSGK